MLTIFFFSVQNNSEYYIVIHTLKVHRVIYVIVVDMEALYNF